MGQLTVIPSIMSLLWKSQMAGSQAPLVTKTMVKQSLNSIWLRPKAFSMMGLSDRNGLSLISPYGAWQSSLVVAYNPPCHLSGISHLKFIVTAIVSSLNETKAVDISIFTFDLYNLRSKGRLFHYVFQLLL